MKILMVYRKSLSVAALAILSACGDRVADAGPLVRDSAGIRIVESANPAWATPWRVAAEPTVSIGALEGDPAYEFTRILGALRLRDRRLVVADGTSLELRFFDEDGQFLNTVGGSGGGPGEFETLEQLGRLPGDSLFAYGRWRASIFDGGGEFVRSLRIEPPEAFVYLKTLGHLVDGSFLTMQGAFPIAGMSGPTRVEREQHPVFRYSALGAYLGEFGTFPSREVAIHPGSRGGFNTGPREFGSNTTILAHQDRVYVADNASYEIQVFGQDGSLQSLHRKRHEPVPVTAEDIEALRAPRLANEERRPMMERYFRDLPAPPETMPAFGYQLLVDDVANLWVIEYERPSESQQRRWTVFDVQGRWLTTLQLPDGYDLMDAGDDWVLGRVRDEFDVEYVQLYELIKDTS